jgi:IS5 family transposase
MYAAYLKSSQAAHMELRNLLVKPSCETDWAFLESTALFSRTGHPVDGGPDDSQIHLQPFGRGAVYELVYNPYYQYFCGEEFFEHELMLERSLLWRWGQAHGR